MSKYTIISYCNNRYPKSYGGVARYDYCLQKVFPERKFFKGPQELELLLEYLKRVKFPIVITDNHLACDIPKNYPLIIVHHGIARVHAERDPDWDSKWKDLCVRGQDKIFDTRLASNTWFISPSTFCTHYFNKIYDKYKDYRIFYLPHASELDESKFKNWDFKSEEDYQPIILGNWSQPHKGSLVIEQVKNILKNKFRFVNLDVKFEGDDFEDFNKRKQEIYCNADIYLALSSHEGNSYALLDAFLNNLLIVSTNVGWTYKDVNLSSFMKIPYNKMNDPKLVASKIVEIWNKKRFYINKSREEYLEKITIKSWSDQMKEIVKLFYIQFYYSSIISEIEI